MRKGTLLLMLALFAGLGFLWLRMQRETLQGGPALAEFPLFPDLVPERVRALRIDHVERGFQLKLERDAAGRWFMTDPVEYPAHAPLVRTLLEQLERARGEPAPEAELAQVALDLPHVVVECVQVGAAGGGAGRGGVGGGGVPGDGAPAERTLRVELGAIDLDSSKVYARIPAHPGAENGVFRTSRALANTLERIPDDYRDRSATPHAGADVISIRRRGLVYLAEEGQRVGLDFDALLGPDGWKRVTQPTVSLDPTAMGLLARGAAELTVQRFIDDAPRDVSRWGLAEPAFTLEIEVLDAEPVVLAFGHAPVEGDHPIADLPWFCQRQGRVHVWEVEARDVELLTRPAELFFDQLLVRMLRSDVARLELEGGGARRVLEREKKGWSVREESGVAGASPPEHPGNPGAIEEALALLERSQLPEHMPGEAFEPAEPPLAFQVVLQNGARLGGRLGRATRDPKSGAQGRQFLRDGDEVVALIGDDVAALCARPLDEFRSRKVHQVQESLVRAIELEHAGRTFTFVNTGENVWNPEGQLIQAPPDFLQSLDALLNLGALRWLETAPAHERVLAVRVQRTDGEPLSFTFVRTPEGTTLGLTEAGQVAEVDGALVDRLLALY